MYKAMCRWSYGLHILGLLSKHQALHTPFCRSYLFGTVAAEFVIKVCARSPAELTFYGQGSFNNYKTKNLKMTNSFPVSIE